MIYIDTPVSYIMKGRPVRAAHMISNTPGGPGTTELIAFAIRIGLRSRWIQKRGSEYEHFDVMNRYIAIAIDAGAVQIERRRLIDIVRQKRGQSPVYSRNSAEAA